MSFPPGQDPGGYCPTTPPSSPDTSAARSHGAGRCHHALEQDRLGLTSEIKWEKVGPGIVERYEQFVALFFDQLLARRAFMRVMFTHNVHVPTGLTPAQAGESY